MLTIQSLKYVHTVCLQIQIRQTHVIVTAMATTHGYMPATTGLSLQKLPDEEKKKIIDHINV